ncbi:hypothetical protein ISN44_As08g024250, partial [Arabidopsis suecica]
IPKFLNVISKFPFLIINLIGLILCFYPEDYFSFSLRDEKIGWTCFYIGVTAVAFGSSYYHLHPNDAALLWDPLPNFGFDGKLVVNYYACSMALRKVVIDDERPVNMNRVLKSKSKYDKYLMYFLLKYDKVFAQIN